MKALRKRVLAKRAQAAAAGESLETPADDERFEDEPEDGDAAPAVVGPRNQPASRNRGQPFAIYITHGLSALRATPCPDRLRPWDSSMSRASSDWWPPAAPRVARTG